MQNFSYQLVAGTLPELLHDKEVSSPMCSALIVPLMKDLLWDCPKVVLKTTFGQSKRWSCYESFSVHYCKDRAEGTRCLRSFTIQGIRNEGYLYTEKVR